MILIAASLYLPQHINFLVNRALFYWQGDDAGVTDVAAAAVKDVIKNTSTVMADMAKETIQIVGTTVEGLREGVTVSSGRGELWVVA